VIDRLRKEIQERLDQLLHEADRLRRALAALDPRGGPSERDGDETATRPQRSRSSTRRRSSRGGTATRSARTRTAPGATKARVLGSLSETDAKTAGDVAAATGLARGTVSTTLSKLAKSGEIVKAERGYLLPATTEVVSGAPVSSPGPEPPGPDATTTPEPAAGQPDESSAPAPPSPPSPWATPPTGSAPPAGEADEESEGSGGGEGG
jgi:hypothetical protein